ncbi:hypothetical protein LR48_Vigan09g076000 [Vigna angularis]|uniref:Uncharacterized protein n=1 Tax=Phaseolus angularis TaxID=3914 RepID=A0A0L9VAK8_PHAAN|nr:hypothetical protein LR48_Vigan09g076000 [Vigna angularis]
MTQLVKAEKEKVGLLASLDESEKMLNKKDDELTMLREEVTRQKATEELLKLKNKKAALTTKVGKEEMSVGTLQGEVVHLNKRIDDLEVEVARLDEESVNFMIRYFDMDKDVVEGVLDVDVEEALKVDEFIQDQVDFTFADISALEEYVLISVSFFLHCVAPMRVGQGGEDSN